MADYPSLVPLYTYDTVDIPTNLTLTSLGPNNLLLNWSAPISGLVSGYLISQATTNDLQFYNIGTTSNTSFIVSGLSKESTYYYSVQSILYDSGTSGFINKSYLSSYVPINLTTNNVPPNITISWQTPIVTGLPISGYRVWRTNQWNGVFSSIGSTLSTFYIDSGMDQTTNQYYRITSLF